MLFQSYSATCSSSAGKHVVCTAVVVVVIYYCHIYNQYQWYYYKKTYIITKRHICIKKKLNKATRDLPRTGSESNTIIFLIYILDCPCPYLLSVETTFQLTSCQNSLHVYLRFGETTSHLTSKWRETFQYFQSHDKIPYIYYMYLEKPPPI